MDAPGSGKMDGGSGGDGDADDGSGADAGDSDASTADTADGGSNQCHALAESHALEGSSHVAACSPTMYLTNPPSSGDHYPYWADYKIYDQPVPWGFLVHQLEHGAVVISYRCKTGCNVDLSAVRAFLATVPPDDVCLARKLISVVPDPDLDVAFAASAWTWTLRADCFDPGAFGDFITQHYGHGLERICSGGVDMSSTGWCH